MEDPETCLRLTEFLFLLLHIQKEKKLTAVLMVAESFYLSEKKLVDIKTSNFLSALKYYNQENLNPLC